MKRFIALFLLLGAALLMAPGIIGYQVEDYYQGWVKELGGSGVEVTSQHYQRDWFGAESRTEVLIELPSESNQQAPQALRFSLVSQIVHGPLTMEGVRLAEIQSQLLVEDEPLLPADYRATITTLIALGGQGHTLIDLPKTRMPAVAQRPAIEFGGLRGEIRFEPGLEQIASSLAMPSLAFSNEAGSLLELEGVRLESSSARDDSGLLLGEGQFEIDRFNLVDKMQETRLLMTKLGVDAASDSEGDLVSAYTRYRLDKLVVDDTEYGPAEIKIGVANLPSDVLFEIQQSVEQINAESLSEQQKGAALMSVLMGNAAGLLENDPMMKVETLRINTPEGVVEGGLSLQAVDMQLQEFGNLPVMLNKLVADVSLQMPEAIFRGLLRQKVRADLDRQIKQQRIAAPDAQLPTAEQQEQIISSVVEQQLSVLLGQEFVVRRDGMLSTSATLADGLLSVNGKTIPIPGQPSVQ